MAQREAELSDGEISTTASISSESNTSEIISDISKMTPNGDILIENDENEANLSHDTMATTEIQNGGGTANSWSTNNTASSTGQLPPYSQTSEIRDILTEFHSKISDKIETSQNSLKENFEQSQRDMRESIITEFRGLVTTEVLSPLKNSIDEANNRIARLEQDHLTKITDNASKIENAKEQLQQQITALENRLTNSTSTPAEIPSRHSFNPALLSRLNNIVISGVEEESNESNENLKSKVQAIADAVQCELDAFKVKRLGKKNENGPRPRPRQILIQLANHWDRKKFYAARSKLKSYTTDEDPETKPYEKVFFNEDLDKQQASLFYKGRQAKIQGLIKSIWTYGCQVYYAKLGNETPIALTSESQLPKLQDTQMAAPNSTVAAPGNQNSVQTTTNTDRPATDAPAN